MKNELKAIIYAPYVGVVKIGLKDDFTLSGYSRTTLDYGDCSSLAMDQISYDGCFIEVKSLLTITKEDELLLCDIIETMDCSYFIKGALSTTKIGYALNLKKSIEAIDFLRSKGYALPHKEYSVDELVKAKVYKLI